MKRNVQDGAVLGFQNKGFVVALSVRGGHIIQNGMRDLSQMLCDVAAGEIPC